jgi:hypothetical protein
MDPSSHPTEVVLACGLRLTPLVVPSPRASTFYGSVNAFFAQSPASGKPAQHPTERPCARRDPSPHQRTDDRSRSPLGRLAAAPKLRKRVSWCPLSCPPGPLALPGDVGARQESDVTQDIEQQMLELEASSEDERRAAERRQRWASLGCKLHNDHESTQPVSPLAIAVPSER